MYTPKLAKCRFKTVSANVCSTGPSTKKCNRAISEARTDDIFLPYLSKCVLFQPRVEHLRVGSFERRDLIVSLDNNVSSGEKRS